MVVDELFNSWTRSLICAPPDLQSRPALWQTLSYLNPQEASSCLLAGDFNQVLHQEDKFSYTTASIPGANFFQDFIEQNCLLDLSVKGPHFTWTNYRKRKGIVFEKLDRFLCSTAWMELYPDNKCSKLSIFRSNHSPLFLSADGDSDFHPRPARFEAWWLLAPEAITIIYA